MKGIVLAGGSGTRLYPLTVSTSKQLLPVYDKPMVFYPLSVLMEAGIRDILIISTPSDIGKFKQLLGDGSDFGIKISYEVQPSPDGLAQAFIIGEKFIEGDACALILGDNLFHGNDFNHMLREAVIDAERGKSTIFGYPVKNPQRFGVVEFDSEGNVIGIEEKPVCPKSDYCVTGLYFYDKDIVEIAKSIKPSPRGELEITDVNRVYLEKKKLHVEQMGHGYAWLDTGTHDSLMQAAAFVQTIQARQGLKIACIEEIAYQKGYIDKQRVLDLSKPLMKNEYGQYLARMVEAES